jgi:probable addiction module antidote protein
MAAYMRHLLVLGVWGVSAREKTMIKRLKNRKKTMASHPKDLKNSKRGKLKQTDRVHGEIVVDLLNAYPEFADEYLAATSQEADQPGGQQALLLALRHVAEAQGMAVANRAGIPRESLNRALGPRGNPTIKTFFAVLNASGLQLSVTRGQ